MSLDFFGFIDGDFLVENALFTFFLKSNVDGRVELTENPNRLPECHSVNWQPLSVGESKQFLDGQGGERYEEVRSFFITDGIRISLRDRFNFKLENDPRNWKPLSIDCQPHYNYCELVAGVLPETDTC